MSVLTPDETLLGLIAVQNCHGYELIETFRNPSELGDVWKMSTSQIYAVLKRLESQRLIVGQVVTQTTAPERKEYTLTAAGQQRLDRWLHDPQPSASIRRIRVEFLSRLYIARRLGIPTIPIVVRQRATCEAERHRIAEELAARESGIGYLAQALVLSQLDAVLDWLYRCELVPKNLDDTE